MNSPARRIPPLAIVLAVSCALSLFIALQLPLLDPDEGRNAEIAREMAVSGDLVIPQLAGMPYLDKPPGFFWAAALSVRALGHTPLAARLPSLLTSLVLLALVGRAAARAGGERFGWMAAALLAAAPLYSALAAYVIFDMMLALCVAVVWLGVAREVADAGAAPNPRASIGRRLAMFAAIAAGILIKGPVMLAWGLGGALGAALVLRSLAPLKWLAWIPGWLVALGAPAAWFWAASARFPEYPHYAFLEESLERLTSNSFHRNHGWWFVPAVLVGGALPWSLATPWSAARWRRAAPDARLTARVGLGFVLFAALFFTLSHSQLVTYLLPALPPLAWCAAIMWSDGQPARGAGFTLAGLSLAVLLPVGWFAFLTTLPAASREPLALCADGIVYALAMSLGLLVLAAILGAAQRAALLLRATVIAWWPLIAATVLPMWQACAPFHHYVDDSRPPSGAYLAHAIAAAGGPSVIFWHCYSPGTDFLLGRTSLLVSTDGHETTSNYIERYRETLMKRGLWRALPEFPGDTTSIVVGELGFPRMLGPLGKAPKPPRPSIPPRHAWYFVRIYSDRSYSAWRYAHVGERADGGIRSE